MMWWARNRINIRCSRCGDVFEGAMHEPMKLAWVDAKQAGWRAQRLSKRQAREIGARDEWVHHCSGCVAAAAGGRRPIDAARKMAT
jgi:hypothetical protein